MNNTDSEVITYCHRWLNNNHTIYLLTIMETWGSSPRPAGSIAAVRDDGKLLGSVSSGCIEELLVEQLTQTQTISKFPAIVVFGDRPEDALRFQLPCGGVLKIIIEKICDRGHFEFILNKSKSKSNSKDGVIRELDINSGDVQWYRPETSHQSLYKLEAGKLRRFFGPVWQLVIFGNSPVSRSLTKFAMETGFKVIICDPRPEYGDSLDMQCSEFSVSMPDEVVLKYAEDPYTAFITLSHDAKIDDMALMEALKSKSFYVGALGSKKTNSSRRERLSLLDLTDKDIARLHGPVGLPIQSKTPEDIAISILAEVIKEKNTLTNSPLKT